MCLFHVTSGFFLIEIKLSNNPIKPTSKENNLYKIELFLESYKNVVKICVISVDNVLNMNIRTFY